MNPETKCDQNDGDMGQSPSPHPSGSPNLLLPPVPHQLHVAVRGLICIRLSAQTRTITLHVPQMNMHGGHIYRAGTYANLRALTYGDDYHLEGVEPGSYKIDPRTFKTNFAALSLQTDILATDSHCAFHPRSTHATIRLPWPSSFNRLRLRKAGSGPSPLFLFGDTGTLDPNLGYVSYFTYDLQWTDRPILYKGSDTFWYSEALQPHTALHFFADPAMGFKDKTEHDNHVKAAYQAFNDQIFSPAFTLAEGVSDTTIEFQDPSANPDIPIAEQRDLTDPGLLGGGDTGNCLPIIITD